MAFGNWTLTGHFEQLDGVPATGRVQIDGIPQVVIDTAGNKFRVGPRTVVLNATGDFSVSLPSNATTGSSTAIGYRVTVLLKHQNMPPVEFYAPAIGSTLDLADVTSQTVVALTPLGVSQADFNAYVASNPGATNSTVAGYVTGTGSTQAALDARYSLLPVGWQHPRKFGTITYGKDVTSAQAQANAAAVQAAIDAANNGGGIAANTTGGGTVYIDGVVECYTSGATQALTLYGGVHLRGNGPGGDVFSGTDARLPYRGSALRLWSGANQDLIRTANFAALTGVAAPSALAVPNRFGVHDLTLDGNKNGNTSGHCLRIYGRSFWLENLVIQNAAGKGLYTEYGTTAGYDNEAQIYNLRITDCVDHGWDFNGPHDSLITNVFSARNGGSGFKIANAGSTQITNMHNWGNTLYQFDVGSSDASFANCVSDGVGPGSAGVRVTASGVRWKAGSIYGTTTPGEILVLVGDGTTSVTGLDFDTRWFGLANGAVPIAYSTNAIVNNATFNRWVGFINNASNVRQTSAAGRAQIVGNQTLPVTTLNLADTSQLASSGSIYTAGFVVNYTGKTATTLTGVSGGTGGAVLSDGNYVLQSFTGNANSETYEFRSENAGSNVQMQRGSQSTATEIFTYQVDHLAPVLIRNPMSTSQTVTVAGGVTINAAAGNAHLVTLQANATSMTITNPTGNQRLVISLLQDATGGRTYAWPANCHFAGGAAPTPSTTGSWKDRVEFIYNGSFWEEVSRAIGLR